MPATQTQNTRSTAPRGQVIDDLDREWTDLVRSGHFAAQTELWLERWQRWAPAGDCPIGRRATGRGCSE